MYEQHLLALVDCVRRDADSLCAGEKAPALRWSRSRFNRGCISSYALKSGPVLLNRLAEKGLEAEAILRTNSTLE